MSTFSCWNFHIVTKFCFSFKLTARIFTNQRNNFTKRETSQIFGARSAIVWSITCFSNSFRVQFTGQLTFSLLGPYSGATFTTWPSVVSQGPRVALPSRSHRAEVRWDPAESDWCNQNSTNRPPDCSSWFGWNLLVWFRKSRSACLATVNSQVLLELLHGSFSRSGSGFTGSGPVPQVQLVRSEQHNWILDATRQTQPDRPAKLLAFWVWITGWTAPCICAGLTSYTGLQMSGCTGLLSLFQSGRHGPGCAGLVSLDQCNGTCTIRRLQPEQHNQTKIQFRWLSSTHPVLLVLFLELDWFHWLQFAGYGSPIGAKSGSKGPGLVPRARAWFMAQGLDLGPSTSAGPGLVLWVWLCWSGIPQITLVSKCSGSNTTQLVPSTVNEMSCWKSWICNIFKHSLHACAPAGFCRMKVARCCEHNQLDTNNAKAALFNTVMFGLFTSLNSCSGNKIFFGLFAFPKSDFGSSDACRASSLFEHTCCVLWDLSTITRDFHFQDFSFQNDILLARTDINNEIIWMLSLFPQRNLSCTRKRNLRSTSQLQWDLRRACTQRDWTTRRTFPERFNLPRHRLEMLHLFHQGLKCTLGHWVWNEDLQGTCLLYMRETHKGIHFRVWPRRVEVSARDWWLLQLVYLR